MIFITIFSDDIWTNYFFSFNLRMIYFIFRYCLHFTSSESGPNLWFIALVWIGERKVYSWKKPSWEAECRSSEQIRRKTSPNPGSDPQAVRNLSKGTYLIPFIFPWHYSITRSSYVFTNFEYRNFFSQNFHWFLEEKKHCIAYRILVW